MRLEGLCADAWPAVVDRPLGGWRLRAAGGWTGRANSALAIGDPGRPVAGALDVVLAFAEEHGIRPRVQAPIGSPWDRAVAGQGWVLDAGHVAGAEVAVLVADLDRLVGRGPAVSVELPEHPDEAWWELAAGSPDPAQRSVVDPPGLRTAFGLVREPEGAAAGVMRATVVEDHLHLSLLEVVAGARRRGVATGLLAATAQWGRERGARWAVLQVALRNSDARALYDRHGFVEHHRYRYLVPDE